MSRELLGHAIAEMQAGFVYWTPGVTHSAGFRSIWLTRINACNSAFLLTVLAFSDYFTGASRADEASQGIIRTTGGLVA
jgi:hypothetical protein